MSKGCSLPGSTFLFAGLASLHASYTHSIATLLLTRLVRTKDQTHTRVNNHTRAAKHQTHTRVKSSSLMK